MLGDYLNAERIVLITGYTDLRMGIPGLSMTVEYVHLMDPCANTLYLFCGRSCKLIKALYWEGDGFVMLTKRLSKGRYKWPRDSNEALTLSDQQFRWLTEGLSITQKTSIPKT